jgi:DNA mismatch repair protein MutL
MGLNEVCIIEAIRILEERGSPVGRKINILPPHLINRIAAGEVVERPASVVKELVENALDAGATRIDIMAGAAGRNIRVADNGCGMVPEDAALAFYNHATSKIQDAVDLDRIETLGFRGEALASIGSIAKLTCLTRTADATLGTKVSLNEQGEPILTEVGCAPGTIMEVTDLFYNTPARLKFLKRAQTELGQIEETVQYLALSHPEVRFSLTLNEKPALKTSGSGELRQTIDEVFGLQRENIRLVPITAQDGEAGLQLAGFTSEPGVMKSSKRWMLTYVNGRHVRCSILQKAIEGAYESLLPHGKYPLCVFFVNLPSTEVDVNVHPTKREVRYAAGNTIFGFVRSGILNGLSSQGISLGQTDEINETTHLDHFTVQNPVAGPNTQLQGPHSLQPKKFEPTDSGRFSPPVANGHFSKGKLPGFSAGVTSRTISRSMPHEPQPVQAAINFYQPQSAHSEENRLHCAPTESTETSHHPSRFKVIGQLFNTYILLETVQGLMVVDQHIASERAFFESLTLNLTGTSPDIQKLVTAHPLTVSPMQRDLLERYQDAFAQLGFLYTVDKNTGLVELTGYPLVYEGRDKMFESGGLFENLLAQLEETGEMKLDLDHMLATLACHSAVRAGDPLTVSEMHEVIERWLACRLPWTCPHGRPIAHTISKHELNHFFHRPSLPVNAG